MTAVMGGCTMESPMIGGTGANSTNSMPYTHQRATRRQVTFFGRRSFDGLTVRAGAGESLAVAGATAGAARNIARDIGAHTPRASACNSTRSHRCRLRAHRLGAPALAR